MAHIVTRMPNVPCLCVILACLALPCTALAAAGGDSSPEWERALDNEFYKLSLNVRARMEVAKQEGLERSRANTVRVLLGIETKPVAGLSAFAQLESNTAFNNDRYWDQAHASNGKTGIADARHTSPFNQVWGRYRNEELWDLDVKGGRQVIIFDDARFIGNVGWRQNMQTFDSVRGSTDLGIDGLTVTSGYIWEVLRIFDDQGPSSQEDFDSKSGFFHVSYDKLGFADLSAFAYVLKFDNSPANSSASYGLRATGSRPLAEKWSLPWVASYAYQKDAGRNPESYHAHYVNAELALKRVDLGKLTAGYELLGSDSGKARFVTSLATAHKFNGFADAFLDNGGVTGLQDLYFKLAPELPGGLQGHVDYHRFWSHDKSKNLGHELDAVLSRPFTKHLSGLTKLAVFKGRPDGPADRWRFWVELTFDY
jgi:hypothetical protein